MLVCGWPFLLLFFFIRKTTEWMCFSAKKLLAALNFPWCGIIFQWAHVPQLSQSPLLFSMIFWLVVWLPFFIFPYDLGMSSSQLTNSIIFQRSGQKNHQPVFTWPSSHCHGYQPLGDRGGGCFPVRSIKVICDGDLCDKARCRACGGGSRVRVPGEQWREQRSVRPCSQSLSHRIQSYGIYIYMLPYIPYIHGSVMGMKNGEPLGATQRLSPASNRLAMKRGP